MKPNELKSARLKMQMTQSELANRLGYSNRSSVSLLESGQRYINPRLKVAIERVLTKGATNETNN
tara:strand:- start:245 stop:439 length:195 start_codon:yes stop_codon:yes gene_type:complete